MIGGQCLACRDGALEQRIGAIQSPEPLEDAGECLVELRLHDRFRSQRCRVDHATFHQRHRAQRVTRLAELISTFEQAECEALDLLGAFRCEHGRIARGSNAQCRYRRQRDDHRERRAGRHQCRAVPSREFGRSIPRRIRARLERFVPQIVLHVAQ